MVTTAQPTRWANIVWVKSNVLRRCRTHSEKVIMGYSIPPTVFPVSTDDSCGNAYIRHRSEYSFSAMRVMSAASSHVAAASSR